MRAAPDRHQPRRLRIPRRRVRSRAGPADRRLARGGAQRAGDRGTRRRGRADRCDDRLLRAPGLARPGRDGRPRGGRRDRCAEPARGPDRRRGRRRRRLLLDHAREPRRAASGPRMQLVAAAVELERVSFGYVRGATVLRDVDLRIEPGEFVAVAGPNGGGKTTLIRLVLGLERAQTGRALLFGEPAHAFARRRTLGYLAQRSSLGTDAPATVREVVAAGRLARRRPARSVEAARPADRRRRDRPRRARRPRGFAAAASLRWTAAAGVHREGAGGRALAARPRRADSGCRRRGAGRPGGAARPRARASSERRSSTSRTSSAQSSGMSSGCCSSAAASSSTGRPLELPGVWHDPSHVHV